MFKKFRKFSQEHSGKALVIGYLTYALIGWLFLCLPFCQIKGVSLLDNFFTAISAVSTTGLVTIDIGSEYTLIGQVAIFLMIQAGGIGYMTFSSFVILATTRKLSSYRQKMASSAFSLPQDFSVKEFIKHVVVFTLICELIGAILLCVIFKARGIDSYVWDGIFHSVSAFCTAGFCLFSDSFMAFKYDLPINIVLSSLSILGAIGFIVWVEFYQRITGKKKVLSFVSKIILSITCSFLVIGTLIFFFTESAPGETIYERSITAFFQVMTASTTVGFNTLDIGKLSTGPIILLLFLMAFGASPSGTGGGLKSTTFAALFSLVKGTLLGKKEITLLGREIPQKRLQLATATFAYYAFVLNAFVFLLVILEDKPFLPVLFEAASALGTVGLSMGITPDLTHFGKILICLLMLMGRVGILTFGVALSAKKLQEEKIKETEEGELVF